MARRASRRAWVTRRPPDEPVARVDFLLTRLSRVGIFAIRDLTRLRVALNQADPTPEQSRRWREQSRLAIQLFRVVLQFQQRDRRRIRRTARRGDEQWLREQLAGLGEGS